MYYKTGLWEVQRYSGLHVTLLDTAIKRKKIFAGKMQVGYSSVHTYYQPRFFVWIPEKELRMYNKMIVFSVEISNKMQPCNRIYYSNVH